MARWNFKGRKGRTYTQISSDTSEREIIPAYTRMSDDSPIFVNVYCLILANTSASVCKVTIKDARAGGTVLIMEVPATDTKILYLESEKDSIEQDSGNNPWTATCTSVAAMEITALFTKD